MKDEKQEWLTEGRGRTAKKNAAKAVEDLARRLVELPDSQLSRLSLREDLARELNQARRIRGGSARKRQIKYLAGMLRKHEDERAKVETILAGGQEERNEEADAFHQLERWRDQLCDADTFQAALAELEEALPHLDMRELSALARKVHEIGDKKAYRAIFRRIRLAVEEAEAPFEE